MILAALSAIGLAQTAEPDVVDAFAAEAIEAAVLRYTTNRQPIYTGEVTFTRGESAYTYAVTGTEVGFADNPFSPAYLNLASASSVTVSVLAHPSGYTVLLSDEAWEGGSPSMRVAEGVFSADPLADFETLTLPQTPYQLDGVTGTLSLTLSRLPVSEVTWEHLVAVSRAAPVDGLDLSRAVQRGQVMPFEGGRLVRGAVVGVPIEIRDTSPTCATYYTYWHGIDAAFDVSISADLTPTLVSIARGEERIEEQCMW
ncbi:MAG: hypothetical protein ACI8RZ_006080 [Myxococcota bacterium]|jgi:hypothetical protein